MRSTLMKSLAALAMCLTVLAWSAPTMAQRSFGFRIQFGGGARAIGLIRATDNLSDRFASMLDSREDSLSGEAHDLANNLSIARSDAENGASVWQVRSHIASAVGIARSINREMRYRGVDYEVQREWSMLRSDLNSLARAYNLGGVGFGYY
jgi:hypothetical protein